MAKSNSDPSFQQCPSFQALPEIALRHHQESLRHPMKEWLNRKSIPPVLLLTGPAGIGKKSFAYFLAQWMTCQKSGFASAASLEQPSDRPCQKCSSCQAILNGNSVDITEISSHSVEAFREVKNSMGFGGNRESFKVILIPSAEKMTLQAANSVLKLLEEPPRNWIFLLTTTDSALLLPTLVSRCQTLRLKPFSAQQIEQILSDSGVESKKIKICSLMSEGSLERALRFSTGEEWEKRDLIFQFVKDPGSTLPSLFDWVAQDDSRLDFLIDLLEQVAADFLKSIATGTLTEVFLKDKYPWTHSEIQTLLNQMGGIPSAQTIWFLRAEKLAQTRKDASLPLNRKLLLQDLLLPWLRSGELAHDRN